MDEFAEQLNDLLVDTFRNILKVEQEMVQSAHHIDLTISELHLLESVAKNRERGMTISDIAEDLDITLPSVTVAINKLYRKGYVEKVRCEKDGRVVYVKLTKLGSKMEASHHYFHRSMVRSVIKDLTEEEKNAMMKGIVKLDQFFKKKLEKMEEN
jgi:DNA-binding MarR family transcriptional regulator